jgi:hypothetical protein
MLVGYLQVVFVGHGFAVSDPIANDVRREDFGQFSLPRKALNGGTTAAMVGNLSCA